MKSAKQSDTFISVLRHWNTRKAVVGQIKWTGQSWVSSSFLFPTLALVL